MCLARMLVATHRTLETQPCFLYLSAARHDVEHATCELNKELTNGHLQVVGKLGLPYESHQMKLHAIVPN